MFRLGSNILKRYVDSTYHTVLILMITYELWLSVYHQYLISPYFIPTIYLTIHHDSHWASMNIYGIHSTNSSQSLPLVLSFDGMEKLILA